MVQERLKEEQTRNKIIEKEIFKNSWHSQKRPADEFNNGRDPLFPSTTNQEHHTEM